MTVEELTKLMKEQGISKVRSALTPLGWGTYIIPTPPTLDSSLLVTGSLKLSNVSGYPVVNAAITVEPMYTGKTVTFNNQIIAIDTNNQAKTWYTDDTGLASIKLVKGSKVRIHIESSNVVRELTVPSTDFDLLDESISTAPDRVSTPFVAPTLLVRSDL
ncbi:MAG: hypothetical protein CL678_15380 [Bdellovibrionaceae bacterium]|nr:hypothetical protein [Pseudobdellovibrionaceae bacterium]